MILISMFLVDILKWGLINSLYYFFPQEDNKRTELLSQTFYLLATIGFICIPIVFILRYLIADLFNSPIFATLVFPISLYFLFMLISLILDSLFILEKKSKIVVIYEITNKTLRAFFVIGAAILFKNVNSVVWSLALFALIRFLFLYIYMKKDYNIGINKIDTSLLISQIRYAFPIGAARLVGEIGRNIDKLILVAFLTPAHYAAYSIAHFGIPFISLFYVSVGQVVIPQMTIENKNQNLAEVKRLWHKIIVRFSLVTIPIVILFGLLAKNVITLLFTYQYINSVPLYRVFLIILLIHILDPSVVLRACKKTKTIFISHMCSMIVAIILSYILIQNYGMMGGAISFIVSSLIRTLIQVIEVKKVLSLSLSSLLPWYTMFWILVFSLIAAIFPILLLSQDMHDLIIIAVSGLVYSLVLLSVYFYSGIVKYQEVIKLARSLVK